MLRVVPFFLLMGVHVTSATPNDWLTNKTVELLKGCELKSTAQPGTVLFTPDASSSYGAQWTRDFAYMLTYAGSLWDDSKADTIRSAVKYTFAGQRKDGCMPDRVQSNGLAVYSPGGVGHGFADHAIDNGPFSGLLLAALDARWPNQALFCALEPQVRSALDFLVLAPSGLLWNDPDAPNCTYGFTDTVAKQGELLFTSLLYLQASEAMANLSTAYGCGNASRYASQAAVIRATLQSATGNPLWNSTAGLFNACSEGANALPDVWGSALAVTLGVATPAQASSIGSVLSSTAGIFQKGQVRHLPPPLYWGKCFGGCPAKNTYQNGAYWATPLPWVTKALRLTGHASMIPTLLNDTLTNFQTEGVEECVFGSTYHGVVDYVDSGSNTYAAWNAM